MARTEGTVILQANAVANAPVALQISRRGDVAIKITWRGPGIFNETFPPALYMFGWLALSAKCRGSSTEPKACAVELLQKRTEAFRKIQSAENQLISKPP